MDPRAGRKGETQRSSTRRSAAHPSLKSARAHVEAADLDRPPRHASALRETPAAAVEHTLRDLGVRPSRELGQSFLTDPFVADAEAALVGPVDGRTVLEIGGGLGVLTEALLRRGIAPLTVVEKDPRLAAHLARQFGTNVTVVEADAREWPLPTLSAAVGNLPYASATPIFSRLLRAGVPRFVGMVQREVAERLAARPGTKAYGRMTILTAAFGSIELFRVVPPSSFLPPPAVESRIFTFQARSDPPRPERIETLERILSALFSSRRKQLGNLIPRLGPAAAALADRADWPEGWRTLRPESLPPEAYFALAETIETG